MKTKNFGIKKVMTSYVIYPTSLLSKILYIFALLFSAVGFIFSVYMEIYFSLDSYLFILAIFISFLPSASVFLWGLYEAWREKN